MPVTNKQQKYMGAVECLVALIRLSAARRTEIINLYRATEEKDIPKVFSNYTEKQLGQIAAIAERWGDDEAAEVNYVHQHFPPPAYPAGAEGAEDQPVLGNLMELYAGAREQGIIAPDSPGWVDVCKLAVEQGKVEQQRAGFKAGKRFVPSFRLAVKADLDVTKARLKDRQPEAKRKSNVPGNLKELLG